MPRPDVISSLRALERTLGALRLAEERGSQRMVEVYLRAAWGEMQELAGRVQVMVEDKRVEKVGES